MNHAADASPPGEDPFAGFRRDHARVLQQLDVLEQQVLRRTGEVPEAPVRDAIRMLHGQFATHMTAEDDVLFPLLHAAFPEARGLLAPLQGDHLELRGMLTALDREIARPRSTRRDEQIVVVMRDFIDLLRLHIHKEEVVVFDFATRVLSREQVAEFRRRVPRPDRDA